MGFGGNSTELLESSYFGLIKGFSGTSTELLNSTYFGLIKGFSGASTADEAINVSSIVLVDNIGNINTFAITNASLEDLSGVQPSETLTFLPNVWTANESLFFFGFDVPNIRINFDIAGTTFLGNPFNITEVEFTPNIIVL